MTIDASMYAPAGERSWAQREADAAAAVRLVVDVAGDAARREVLDLLGVDRCRYRDWRRAVHEIRTEAALWRAQRVIAACDAFATEEVASS